MLLYGLLYSCYCSCWVYENQLPGCPFLATFPRIPMGHAGHAASRRDVGMVGGLQDLLSVYTLVMTFTVCHGKIHPFLSSVNHLFRFGPWLNHGEVLVITRGYPDEIQHRVRVAHDDHGNGASPQHFRVPISTKKKR